MGIGRKFTETCTLRELVNLATRGAGTVTSGWWAVETRSSWVALVVWGDVAVGATLDLKLEQATDASGTSAKDISSKVGTQVGDTDDNGATTLTCDAGDLDLANSYSHFRLSATVAGGNVDYTGLVMEYHNSTPSADDLNAAFSFESK